MEVYEYDIERELKAFDDTKAGVKGLVDSGVTKIPRIFYHNTDDQNTTTPNPIPDESPVGVPTIDLGGVEADPIRREEAVKEVRAASEAWGFFQVVNHGVSPSVVEEMLDGVTRFFEQETDAKREFYTRDPARPVRYNSNFDLFRVRAASWRDTLFCAMAPTPPMPEDLPVMCRDILFEYSKQVTKLGFLLFELLSEALGLNRNYLRDMDCAKGHVFLCHYSPPCPKPELTLGTRKHTDGCFLTVLLQDRVGGLQVLHRNRWIDVNPISGALVVNIGDLLQLVSNDKFKSVEHRVLVNREVPRASIACFFRTDLHDKSASRAIGPIKELFSEDTEDPPKYRDTTLKEFITHYNSKGLDGTSSLSHFRL